MSKDHGTKLIVRGFDERIRAVYDHLYANANVRTPDRIASEVLKLIDAFGYTAREQGGLRRLTPVERRAAERADERTVLLLTDEAHGAFSAMNASLRHYPKTAQIELDPRSVAFVRAQLDDVPFGGDRDWVGDAVEIFRSVFSKRAGGQFFTDQRVTALAMSLLEFDPSGDDLIDICAGTGGFLLAAAAVAREQRADSPKRTVIVGLEVDRDVAQIANNNVATKLGPLDSYVLAADSLADPRTWSPRARRMVGLGRHECLASNPPFGTKTTVKDDEILAQYDLARAWRRAGGRWRPSDNRLAPRPPDVLFIERNLMLAAPAHGRVAIVLPYQTLSGPQLGFVREWILRNARIRAVIDLPAETFQPHTGTKTCLVVLERRAKALTEWRNQDRYEIFMGIADHIGHDRRGNPVLEHVNGEPSIKTDLPLVADAFRAWRRGTDPSAVYDKCFVVQSDRITPDVDLRLNAAFHRPQLIALWSDIADGNHGDWRVTTVGDASKRIFCPGRFKRNYVNDDESGILFLGGTGITQLLPSNEKRLSPDDPRLAELLVEPGWILVTRSGSTGVVSSVPAEWKGVAVSDHVIRIVPDETALDPGYLYAYLRSDVGQQLLRAGVFGSVIDEITPEHIASIPVPVPLNDALVRRVGNSIRAAERGRSEAIAGIRTATETLSAALGRR